MLQDLALLLWQQFIVLRDLTIFLAGRVLVTMSLVAVCSQDSAKIVPYSYSNIASLCIVTIL